MPRYHFFVPKNNLKIMTECTEHSIYLRNLVEINQRAGVDSEVLDLIESYARLRLGRNREVDFYNSSRPISEKDPDLRAFLEKNKNLDERTRNFLVAYYQELKDRHLCCIFSSDHLAHLLQISLPRLHALTRDSRNYHVFTIKKSSGADRIIQAPHKQLKTVQRKILSTILHPVPLNKYAEGFRKKRSILTNATHHVNKKVIVKLDIKDFFPSIDSNRVFGMYLQLGYPRRVAQLLTDLSTVQKKLPTGAPTSPTIANIISRRLDKRFVRLGLKTDFTYSRYADDITISSDTDNILKMIPFFKEIIHDEGFTVNEGKIRILRSGSRQSVTGVVVNEKPNIKRREIKKLRAVLHNSKRGSLHKQAAIWAMREKGLKNYRSYSVVDFYQSLLAKIHFVRMINEKAGNTLLADFYRIPWPVIT
ncbi:MAG TPA: RNA-directed DNA polymerase [Gammaproteobacteria bacterium]|nr:RNA-directed DNA polymerase [Gammaproteobacteria bacterium]